MQFAYNRNVLGVHYLLDVIGGRILAEQSVAALLNDDPDYDAGSRLWKPPLRCR